MAISADAAIWLILFTIAFIVTTIVVIVLVCLDWCTRTPVTETVEVGMTYVFSPDQTPPGNTLTITPGKDPNADLAWRRSGALLWVAFELDFSMQVTPTDNLTELQFLTLTFEMASDRLPRMKIISKEDTIFTAIGSAYILQGRDENESPSQLTCEIDVQRLPHTVILVTAKNITLPVDANGLANFRSRGNLVLPVKTFGCCEPCCAPNTDAWVATHAKFD